MSTPEELAYLRGREEMRRELRILEDRLASKEGELSGLRSQIRALGEPGGWIPGDGGNFSDEGSSDEDEEDPDV